MSRPTIALTAALTSLLCACATPAVPPVVYAPAPVDPARYPSVAAALQLNDRPGHAWTDADLLDQTLPRSAALANAQAAYRAAVATSAVARAAAPITLGLQTEYANDAATSSAWLFGVSADIPLDRSERRAARLAAADLAGLGVRYDYGDTLWTLRSTIRRAHIERIASERQATLANALVAARQGLAQRVNRRVAAGEDARAAAITAQADVVRAKARLSSAQAAIDQANAELAGALGVAPSVAAALKLADITADPTQIDAKGLNDFRRSAALTRTEIARGLAAYDQAEAALRVEIAKQQPEIIVSPGYTWERGLTKLPFNISLVLPRDGNRPAIALAEAQRAQAGTVIEAAQAAILASVDQAAAADRSGATALAAALQDIAAAERLVTLTRRSLAAGEIDALESEAAQAAVIEAQLSAIDAWRAAWLASVGLEDALRRPADATETAVLAQAMGRLKEPR
ncbi:hypothetical protein BH11PSE2_BH11PSE2_11850 [soil metagenome]